MMNCSILAHWSNLQSWLTLILSIITANSFLIFASQIRVNSSEKFKIKQVDDEMEMEDPGVWSWIVDSATSMLKERVNETYLNVDLFSNKTCFKVEPSSKVDYNVLLTRREYLVINFVPYNSWHLVLQCHDADVNSYCLVAASLFQVCCLSLFRHFPQCPFPQ